MSDGQHGDAISRRQALWRLLATAVPFKVGLLPASTSQVLAAQLGAPPNVRVLRAAQPAADSAVARGVHPRTFLTPARLSALRAQLASDSGFRARWQTAVSQFEDAGGYWATPGGTSAINPATAAFAAFLACVRRPDNDLGLTWRSSWQYYRDRVVKQATDFARANEGYEWAALAGAAVYDLLHADLTPAERATLSTYVTAQAARQAFCLGRWDDQRSASHVARVVCCLAADDAVKHFPVALDETQDWAEAREWIAYNSLGYEWKNAYPTNTGQILCLWMLKEAGNLTAAETTDKHLYHLQHAWQLLRQFVIPHPGRTAPIGTRTNMVQPIQVGYAELNVAAHLLWGWEFLDGRTNLDATRDVRGLADGAVSDQKSLAVSEAALMGYARDYWDAWNFEQVLDFKWVFHNSPTSSRGHIHTFCLFPAWLILNVQIPSAVTAEAAGIPLVRRWWPGTLDLTTIRSGHTISSSTESLVTYFHKRYYINSYEGNARNNGSWQVHRAGPLLIQRGSASHGVLSRKWTHAANGTVSFIDPNLYPMFFRANADDFDLGGVREAPTSDTKAEVLAKGAAADMGRVTAWHADGRVVAITSDLTRSYNSTHYANPRAAGNEAKISDFVREFVCVRRGADGTDHERIFTYDRIALLDTKFEPRYNLCPATEPDINGTETPFTPWAPPDGSWKASGPTRWDYTGATRLIYDNTKEPAVSRTNPAHTEPGQGKVCVTWLQPSGTAVKVTKRGGTNAYVEPAQKPSPNGAPGIGPWNEWAGLDGEWDKVNNTSARAYAGLYTVEVMPRVVSRDTRFLMACDVMSAGDTPDAAQQIASDGDSVAARCGATVVVFGRDARDRQRGSVTIPEGVALVVLVNMRPNQPVTLSGGGGLRVEDATVTTSSTGVLTVSVAGSGVLEFR